MPASAIPRIVVLVSGAVALGLSVSILAGGAPDAETQRSMLTIGMLFVGLGLLIIGIHFVMEPREKPRD